MPTKNRPRSLVGIDFATAAQADERLATLGRGLGALRLALGEGLCKLSNGQIQDLGFPGFDSYVREALGRSARWAADLRALARRLMTLPRLRTALRSGHLSSSMVELVARVATPLDEAEWIERALAMNVRQLRAELKQLAIEVGDDEVAPRTTIALTHDRVDAWGFEQARMTVEAVGARRGDEAIEAILAEGLGELLAQVPDIDLPAPIAGERDDDRALRLELAALRDAAEGAVEAIRPRDPVATPVALPEIIWAPDGPSDVRELDAQLRDVAQMLAVRDVELGQLACLVIDHEIWRAFGYFSFEHYCRERIGLSPSSVKNRMALTRRLAGLPAVREALVKGRISYERAVLVARVASAATAHAWIERATERTVKQLGEEVDAVMMFARVEGQSTERIGPPDAAMVDAAHSVERAVIARVSGVADESQMSGGPVEASGDGQMSGAGIGEIGVGTTTLRLSLSQTNAQFWFALERLHSQMSGQMYGQMSGGHDFVPFLVNAVAKSWRGACKRHVQYRDVYVRERWRCASPVCRSRNVTPHHVRFRSAGGGEERANLVALCDKCHLELVHENRLRVSGTAPDGLDWVAAGWQVPARDCLDAHCGGDEHRRRERDELI